MLGPEGIFNHGLFEFRIQNAEFKIWRGERTFINRGKALLTAEHAENAEGAVELRPNKMVGSFTPSEQSQQRPEPSEQLARELSDRIMAGQNRLLMLDAGCW